MYLLMRNSRNLLTDLWIAIGLAITLELCLLIFAFFAQSDPKGVPFWLSVSQMPGAPIAEIVFRHTYLKALICEFLIQSAIFAVTFLGVIYTCRLLTGRLIH
jgi:hypothetical protein